jgi:arylsulfatase A-like enzyme
LHLTPSLGPAGYGFPESEPRWDAGGNDDWHGPYYGFRHVELTHGHGEGPMHRGHYAQWLAREHPEVLPLVAAGRTAPQPVPEIKDLYLSQVPADLHHSAWIADRAAAWLERGRDPARPFCLFLGFPDPHHPFTPCADTWPRFEAAPVAMDADPDGAGLRGNPGFLQDPCRIGHLEPVARAVIRRATAAMVWQIDHAVGRVLAVLDRLGLAEDTVVIFTADHGDFLGDHGLLRKWVFASDCLLRVPFLLRAPGAGLPRVVDAPMSNADVLPTLAGLTGIAPPPHLHGRDAVAGLRSGGRQAVFAQASVGRPESINLTVYDHRFRYTCFPHAGFAELFDHAEDPGECRNRADDPALAGERRRLHALLAEGMLATWMPNLAGVAAW